MDCWRKAEVQFRGTGSQKSPAWRCEALMAWLDQRGTFRGMMDSNLLQKPFLHSVILVTLTTRFTLSLCGSLEFGKLMLPIKATFKWFDNPIRSRFILLLWKEGWNSQWWKEGRKKEKVVENAYFRKGLTLLQEDSKVSATNSRKPNLLSIQKQKHSQLLCIFVRYMILRVK